jgi:ankyrin repeat protein
MLADRGAVDVCQTQSGRTALHDAATDGHTHCVRLLLECGANTDVKEDVRDIICRYPESGCHVLQILYSPSALCLHYC